MTQILIDTERYKFSGHLNENIFQPLVCCEGFEMVHKLGYS